MPDERPIVEQFPVVTLCGSLRFQREFDMMAKELSLQGFIVITAHCNGKLDDDPRIPENKEMLDRMHFAKIDMSESIVVIDVDGYIGESTRNEINYAKEKGILIGYYSDCKFVR